MLLPSALPCKQPGPPATTTALSTTNATSSSSTTNPYALRSHTSYNNTRTRTSNRAAPALSSPPSSSDEIALPTTIANNHLFRSCRALQSMLSSPPTTATNAASVTAALGSPIRFAPASGVGRRIGRTGAGASAATSRRAVAPRGVRKRRRNLGDIDGDGGEDEEGEEKDTAPPQSPWLTRSRSRQQQQKQHQPPPSTPLSTTAHPKRPRLASPSQSPPPAPIWTPADDSALVALVLQKLRLSRGEWAGCARGLGLRGDRGARDAGQRWRVLVEGGRVGLLRKGGGG
ncbi:MAG: hypothetical protein M1839_001153 [Geoglossum umbratile]|nr:MAG: hypothetical protein M1839_001153 [Geoglossum umbratile]